MGRRVHYNTPCHAHELTFSCYRRGHFLKNPLYCQYLCDAIQASRIKYRFAVWAYVFMPSHVHLLIYSVSRRVMIEARRFGVTELKRFRTNSKSRPYRFWQTGGGYDRNIVNRSVLAQAIDYIHNNPVRAGLVKAPEEWKWSSYLDWAGMGVGPLEIDGAEIPLT